MSTVMLSASLPDEERSGLRARLLQDLVVALVGGLLVQNHRLVFGGHPSVTPLVHRLMVRLTGSADRVELFQAAPFRGREPPEVRAFPKVTWCGPPDDVAAALTEMREAMVRQADALVLVGGKTVGFRGNRPGIRDEFERFCTARPEGSVYLLGLLKGETERILDELQVKGATVPNRLCELEREALHLADDVDLVAAIVLADLARGSGSCC